MTLRELKFLVSGGESDTVEFKRKISEPEKIVREMIAFANSSGGNLLIGVNDDLTIPGLKFPEEEMLSLEAAIKKLARPKLIFTKKVVEISRKRSVVVYYVPESKKKPLYIFKNYRKYSYLRKEDRTVKASREMVHIIRKKNHHKGEHIVLGENEMLLLNYLKENHHITLSQFRSMTNLENRVASQTLVTLVSAGVLQVDPGEMEDKFFATEFE